MDIQIVKEREGKKYNKFDQQVIPCVICGDGTTMLGTEQCDRCYELDTRIRQDLDIADRIINYYKSE